MLKKDGVNFRYFKLKLFDLTESIVWNIKGLRDWVVQIKALENLSLWQRLNLSIKWSGCFEPISFEGGFACFTQLSFKNVMFLKLQVVIKPWTFKSLYRKIQNLWKFLFWHKTGVLRFKAERGTQRFLDAGW